MFYVFFVIYDLGIIRDQDEFQIGNSENENVIIKVINSSKIKNVLTSFIFIIVSE
jgi:hypothetical protein